MTASDGSVTGYHKVTVEVTNEDEEGEVTWDTAADGSTEDDRSPLTQFAVGALLTASVEDGDVAGGRQDRCSQPHMAVVQVDEQDLRRDDDRRSRTIPPTS